jgi:hypothetical protein
MTASHLKLCWKLLGQRRDASRVALLYDGCLPPMANIITGVYVVHTSDDMGGLSHTVPPDPVELFIKSSMNEILLLE